MKTKQYLSAPNELERQTIGEYDFNREYNATFLDDQFSYLPGSLVLSCTDDYALNSDPTQGEKYDDQWLIGVDFGKRADHSAVAILQKLEYRLRLVYLKEFPLDTPYTAVIGTVRRLNEAYGFTVGCLDQTGVGEGPCEEIRQFVPVIKGVTLSAPVKENILSRLKLAMEQHKLALPRDDSRLLVQITAQQCEPTISGTLRFSHPPGTHDDCLWAVALAVYATKIIQPRSKPEAVYGE